MRVIALATLALTLAVPAPPARGATPAATLDPIVHAAGGWLNGKADGAALGGKVVLLDVFTFDCINCQHVVPNLKALRARYGSTVAIVGIHSPETPFERERANVVANLVKQGVVWPVALDNGFSLWNAYGIEAWPTQLIFDRHGKLRKTVVGEGSDAELNAEIARLVAER